MKNRTAALGLTAIAGMMAVTLGVGGASAAGLIGSKDIKDNSIKSVDVKDHTLKKRDINSDLVAKFKKPGPPGPQGEPGKDGTANPSAAGAGYDTVWPADGEIHETIETCAEGEYITGGGYSTFGGAGLTPTKDLGGDNPDIQITVSAPYVNSDGDYVPISDTDSRFYADRWVVRGYNNGDTEQVVRAWALCAALPN